MVYHIMYPIVYHIMSLYILRGNEVVIGIVSMIYMEINSYRDRLDNLWFRMRAIFLDSFL